MSEGMIRGLNDLNIPFDEGMLLAFDRYMEGILEYNQKVNLTAITDREKFEEKHYLDSLSVCGLSEYMIAAAENNAYQILERNGKKFRLFACKDGDTMLDNYFIFFYDITNYESLKDMLAADTLSGANINIDDSPALSVFEIKNKCRRLKTEKGLDLVVIDYLQLMKSEGRAESRQQEISNLSRYLKLLAREMDCPVIVLSQLSRAPEQRPNHRPVLSDLRESGSIEQDADIVMFLYRDDYYNEESEKPGICEVNLAKHRSGPTGTLELTCIGRRHDYQSRLVQRIW